MCILEKAIAKIYGNYQQLNGGLVSDGWKIMCGANESDIENWESWGVWGVFWNGFMGL